MSRLPSSCGGLFSTFGSPSFVSSAAVSIAVFVIVFGDLGTRRPRPKGIQGGAVTSVIRGSSSRGSKLFASSMSSSIHASSTNAGGRTEAQVAEADDRPVAALVGSPVLSPCVAGSDGRVVNVHGDGGLNAAVAGGRWWKLEGPLNCMLSRSTGRSKASGCRRNN